MKIILGISGAGKSLKLAELVAEYEKKNKVSHVISGELLEEDVRVRIAVSGDKEKLSQIYSGELTDRDAISIADKIKKGANKTIFSFIENGESVVDILKSDQSDAIFIDGISPHLFRTQGGGYSEVIKDFLEELYEIENSTGKNVYVTVQANLNDSRLADNKICVYDYERTAQ